MGEKRSHGGETRSTRGSDRPAKGAAKGTGKGAGRGAAGSRGAGCGSAKGKGAGRGSGRGGGKGGAPPGSQGPKRPRADARDTDATQTYGRTRLVDSLASAWTPADGAVSAHVTLDVSLLERVYAEFLGSRAGRGSRRERMSEQAALELSGYLERYYIYIFTHFPHMSHPILPIYQNLIRVF